MTLFTFKKLRREFNPSIANMEAGVVEPGEHPAKNAETSLQVFGRVGGK